MPEILSTSTSSFSTSQAIPTGTPPMTSDPELQQAWFNSEWSLPQMALATEMNITYNFTVQQSINLDLVLCQTSATGSDPLTTENTWSVLLLPRKFGAFSVRGLVTDRNLKMIPYAMSSPNVYRILHMASPYGFTMALVQMIHEASFSALWAPRTIPHKVRSAGLTARSSMCFPSHKWSRTFRLLHYLRWKLQLIK
jgi:hypothetical protein